MPLKAAVQKDADGLPAYTLQPVDAAHLATSASAREQMTQCIPHARGKRASLRLDASACWLGGNLVLESCGNRVDNYLISSPGGLAS